MQPKKPRKRKPLRLFPKISRELFKGKDAMPCGKILRNEEGSGYFGNYLAAERMPKGKQLVFHLMPLAEDEEIISKHRKYSWALPSSIGHTAIFLHPRKKAAVVVCIQGTTNMKKLPSKLRSRYRNWHIATLISAIAYCKNRGIKLYAVLPENYRLIHDVTYSLFPESKLSRNIIDFYEKTIVRAVSLLKKRLKKVKTESVFGKSYTHYFGTELWKIL